MALTPEQIEACVDANAAVIGLRLDPAHRPGVIRYFALAAEFAERVMAVPLDVRDEPAESFVPIEPVGPIEAAFESDASSRRLDRPGEGLRQR